MTMRALACVLLCCSLMAAAGQLQLSPALLPSIALPQGFSIGLYSTADLPNARQLAISSPIPGYPEGSSIVYVGSSGTPGSVFGLVDLDGSRQNVTAVTLLSGLFVPNGVAYANGSLWVTQNNVTTMYENADAAAIAGQPLGAGMVISRVFNGAQGDHALHYTKFGPDGYLYANQGSPSNTGPCPVYSAGGAPITECSIIRMAPDGSEVSTYAFGLRNSVGFDWAPENEELWATTNGRDNLNNQNGTFANRPDDFLAWVPMAGLDFGFPYCHWTGVGDPDDRNVGQAYPTIDDVNVPPGVASNNATLQNVTFQAYCDNPMNAMEPAQTLGPHVASLGMTFYAEKPYSTGMMFPAEYNGSIFNAQHGSWDRTPPIGYRVMNIGVNQQAGMTTSYTEFAVGWLNATLAPANDNAWGRPVDVLQMPDGAILVSDDQLGAVYRISYAEEPTLTTTAQAGK